MSYDIGLDFDGLISDCGQLKQYGAKKLYNIDIPPEIFKKELVVNKGILTLEQYHYLQEQIYSTREIGLKMLAVDGALEFIPKLQKESYKLKIITSRGDKAAEIAREWLTLKGLDIKLINVNGNSKAEACKGLDIYIDDDFDKLEDLLDSVKNRYLFSWDYNKHIEVPETVATRIESWKAFYDKIHNLSDKYKQQQQ